MPVKATGFTILQTPPDPALDIIFVHGLQGHPERTWTFQDAKVSAETEGPRKKKQTTSLCCPFFLGKPRKRSATTDVPQPQAVFWPRDLLGQSGSCAEARIITYGYDSVILGLGEGGPANFSTISEHGQALLQGAARVRREDMNRPLMFIAHSLGGLVVKAALNDAFREVDPSAKDLWAVLDSTFAVVFLGTPHRGSANYADFGRYVARVGALLTMSRYNDNIIRSLAPNTEILTRLRHDFDRTYKYMIENNLFESSTFQEGKGLSSLPGFQEKVVDGDSSELGHGDRQQVINKDHRNMCKFASGEDPEYEKVEGEISRHILRLREKMDTRRSRFLKDLETSARFATLRQRDIVPRHRKTIDWLWTAPAKREAEDGSTQVDGNFESWLLSKQRGDIFWITGRPGSGKSTTMKFLFENPKTSHFLARTGQSDWCLIGLFITNRGAEQQRQWEPMLFGLLYQLLQARPALIHRVMPMVEKIKWQDARAGSAGLDHEYGESAVYNWTRSNVEQVLLHCTTQTNYPIKALVVIDGLDELETQEDARQAVTFLKNLAFLPAISQHTFKVCFASRSEKLFLNLLKDGKRVEMHENTQHDIRLHVWDRLRLNSRFRGQDDTEVQRRLKPLMDLICEHAHGVFLWAASVTSLVDESLSDGDTMDDVIKTVAELPTEMTDLYRHIPGRINPRLRQKAYFMLEIVLRARQPPSLLELSLAVEVAESNLSGKPTPWEHSLPDNGGDFLDFSRLQSQLLASCKCLLETVQDSPSSRLFFDDSELGLDTVNLYASSVRLSSYHESEPGLELADVHPSTVTVERPVGARHEEYDDGPALDPALYVVQLLHRTAKEFLLSEHALDELFTSPWTAGGDPEPRRKKPPGNGHVYILQFVRAFQMLPAYVRDRLLVLSAVTNEVRYHAPKVEDTLHVAEAKRYFPLLDDIDRQFHKPDWANHVPRRMRESWKVTFPAFAVSAGMLGYISYLIAKADEDDERDHFLNGKPGRPLLHFAAKEANQPPRPAMADLLLRSGAKVNLTFEGQTAIESLSFDNISETQATYETCSVLLQHGADPNSLHYIKSKWRSSWFPLLHMVACSVILAGNNKTVSPCAIALMRLLVRKGADPNKVDCAGANLIEVLYYSHGHLPQVEWEWLLKTGGAKITIAVVNENMRREKIQRQYISLVGLCAPIPQPPQSRPRAFDVLNDRAFRRREWYADDAAREAERLQPGWFA